MRRNVIDEITRRRLWPIAAIALLVAVAAPLLLLKGSLAAAPGASTTVPAAPATPALGTLPADAQRLLDSSDAPQAAARRRRDGNDPFQPPSSARAASSKGSTKSADTSADEDKSSDEPAARDSTEPVPVIVIADARGNRAGSGTATSTATPIDGGAATTTGSDSYAVDVRFGPGFEGPLHRAIPRRQTFVAGGRVVAIFVKYSPTRKKAVFAIAPTTRVRGDVDCRRKQGVCRYVDIPAGKYVRLTLRATDGKLVTRRLDVHRVRRGAQPASASPANGSCLLAKVLKLTADDEAPTADACRS